MKCSRCKEKDATDAVIDGNVYRVVCGDCRDSVLKKGKDEVEPEIA